MQASEIFEVLNRHVSDEETSCLINNVTDNYARFVGIFRSIIPRLKIIQNLLQSREIRFGDALEEIIGTRSFHIAPKVIRDEETYEAYLERLERKEKSQRHTGKNQR